MVVRMLKVTGRAISRTPRMAAARGVMPRCRYSKTFSPTTMASSTTMPSTTRKANIEIMLMLTPTSGNSARPPTNETTMPIITQKARRYSRKRVRMPITITTANTPFSSSSDRRWR